MRTAEHRRHEESQRQHATSSPAPRRFSPIQRLPVRRIELEATVQRHRRTSANDLRSIDPSQIDGIYLLLTQERESGLIRRLDHVNCLVYGVSSEAFISADVSENTQEGPAILLCVCCSPRGSFRRQENFRGSEHLGVKAAFVEVEQLARRSADAERLVLAHPDRVPF